jgi:hypothetical protein
MTSNFKTALTAGFQTLRARGYFARENWQCCNTCGVAAIPDEYTDFVFYHSQDAEWIAEDDAVRVTWRGDGNEIAKVFRDAGLDVEWDGSKQRRIRVKAATPQIH